MHRQWWNRRCACWLQLAGNRPSCGATPEVFEITMVGTLVERREVDAMLPQGPHLSAEYRACHQIASSRASSSIGNGVTAIRSPANSARPRSNSPRRKRRGSPRQRGSKAQCHWSKRIGTNSPKRVLRSTRSLRRIGETTTIHLRHSSDP